MPVVMSRSTSVVVVTFVTFSLNGDNRVDEAADTRRARSSGSRRSAVGAIVSTKVGVTP